jgi:hypothetical protein
MRASGPGPGDGEFRHRARRFVIDPGPHALSCAVLRGNSAGIPLAVRPDMETVNTYPEIGPMAAATERPVQVLSTSVRIRELNVNRPKVAAYLDAISPDKQELALVHLIEVGVTELLARRDRFKK